MAIAKRDPAADVERRRVRELSRLQSQNAQLKVLARRYTLQQRAARRGASRSKAAPAPTPPPFSPGAMVDPRSAPSLGSRCLPPSSPPLRLGVQMGAAIGRELRAMAIEARALVRRLAQVPETAQAMDAAPNDAAHGFEALRAKWGKRFEALAHAWSRRLVSDITAQSTAQLAHGLRDVASLHAIQSTLQAPRMRAIVEAAAEASVGLITRIPQRYLGDVQAQVMNAITTGSGLDKLVPYLTRRYKGDARHAHLVALDQIRKVSESVNAARVQSLGVEEYVWVATGGERYPRKLHHQHLNGKTFRYDDPPIIDSRTGERGIPGQAINCRCRARPVLNFLKMGVSQ